jgi:WD40 repeat protein
VRYGQVFHHEGTTAVRHLAFDRDGRRLTAVHDDGMASIWNLETKSGMVAGVRTVAASPAAALSSGGAIYIAFDTELQTLKLWELTRPTTPFRQLDGEQQGTTCVARAPDGTTLVTGNSAGTVYLWNLETRRKVATLFRSSKENAISALAFSPNGERLYVGNAAGEVAVLSATAPDQPAGKVKRLGAGPAKVVAIIVAAKEPHVVTLHANNELRWWPEGEGKTAAGDTTSAAFTPDGNTLLTGNTTGEVRVWNVATRQPADPLPLHQEQITAVAAATEQLIATGTADGVVKVWKLKARD